VKSNKEKITIITNLYPLPWEPNRATFNRQQFSLLDENYDKSILVPVAFIEWFKNRKQIKQAENLRFVPYFYPPKLGRRFYSLFLFLSIILHSGNWLRKKRNDILLASWAYPEAVTTSWLSKLYNCRFYFKVHGSDINFHSNYPARARQIVNAANKADGILSVSQDLKTKMIKLGIEKQKITVIYNGINHDLFGTKQNRTINKDYILYVGNLKQAKGVFELLDGFNQIHERFPNLHLIFAGSGEQKNKLINTTEKYGLSDKVEFLGSVNHDTLPGLMQYATLIALPSYNEGVPNVLLESMACGTPVLATAVGGIPEIINQDICGVLIAEKNSDAVALGLQDILIRKWSYEKIVEHSKQFTWQKNQQQLIKLISNII